MSKRVERPTPQAGSRGAAAGPVVERHTVGVGEGLAFRAQAGYLVRFTPTRNSQVVDLNLFRLDDPREHFSASVTRPVHGSHLTEGDSLLTGPPWEREIARVELDTLQGKAPRHDGAVTRSHDLLFGRCSAALRARMYGSRTAGCQETLAAAIAAHGLSELAVHDPLNIFMRTGIDRDGRLFFADPDAGPDDAFTLRLAMDALVALSCCPGRSSGPSPGGVTVEVLESTPDGEG